MTAQMSVPQKTRREGSTQRLAPSPPPPLHQRPEARAESIESLVRKVLDGQIRIPEFQRKLKWDNADVLSLLDSIHSGLPVGSLLLWRRGAPASTVALGPLRIDAPESPQAWWIVDGQQRLAALTITLSRPCPLPTAPVDPWVVYFDPGSRQFRSPRTRDPVGDSWVELPLLLDAARLSEFVIGWKHKDNVDWRSALFEAGKRIREYMLPLYIVETTDSAILREIFYRINKSGKPLQWDEVHDALYGNQHVMPSTISQMSSQLLGMGMGTFPNSVLATMLLASRGLDVTRTLAAHRRENANVLSQAVADALPAIRQVLSFLKRHAQIVHLRLLPRTHVALVLTRVFVVHPAPKPRSIELLRRWIWRTLASRAGADERTFLRRCLAAIDAEEEESVQRLLKMAGRDRPAVHQMAGAFDARSSQSRLLLLALTSMCPRDLETGELIDVAQLIEEHALAAFTTILNQPPTLARHACNRAVHRPLGLLREAILDRIARHGVEDGVLASHGITPSAARALQQGRAAAFIAERARRIEQSMDTFQARLAVWTASDRDRPSIGHMIDGDGDERP